MAPSVTSGRSVPPLAGAACIGVPVWGLYVCVRYFGLACGAWRLGLPLAAIAAVRTSRSVPRQPPAKPAARWASFPSVCGRVVLPWRPFRSRGRPETRRVFIPVALRPVLSSPWLRSPGLPVCFVDHRSVDPGPGCRKRGVLWLAGWRCCPVLASLVGRLPAFRSSGLFARFARRGPSPVVLASASWSVPRCSGQSLWFSRSPFFVSASSIPDHPVSPSRLTSSDPLTSKQLKQQGRGSRVPRSTTPAGQLNGLCACLVTPLAVRSATVPRRVQRRTLGRIWFRPNPTHP